MPDTTQSHSVFMPQVNLFVVGQFIARYAYLQHVR